MAAPNPPADELLRRCHRSYIEGMWQYVRTIPGGTRQEVADGTLIRCDLESSLPNVLFLTHPTSPPSESLRDAKSFFGPRLPWRVITTGSRAPEVGPAATALGMRPGPNEPGMLLDPIPSVPAPPSGLNIQPVLDAARFADFGSVWCDAFRVPRWVLPVALPRLPPDDAERSAQNRFFVGYSGGVPVACATVTVAGGVAGIFSVGTIRKARGRGYGAALTWAAIVAGRDLGAMQAYLAATTMGYPVYQRMGFRRLAEYPSWHTPVGFFRTLGIVRTLRRRVREATRSASPSSQT